MMKLSKNISLKKIKRKITAIILCGGKGSRLRPLTNKIPKPLIKINGEEILSYIIKHILSYNIDNSLILTGYKQEKIKTFIKKKFKKNKNLNILDTGIDTDIIRRIQKGEKYYNDYLLICYGDTLVDLNINFLLKEHFGNKANITISIYNPKINYGIVTMDKSNNLISFLEKPNLNHWINIGFIIISKENFFQISKKYQSFKSFLENLPNFSKVKAFKHFGNHITVNTLNELDEAKKNIKNFKI